MILRSNQIQLTAPDRWTIYGRRVAGLTRSGVVTQAAVHQEGITTEEQAVTEAMKIIMVYPSATLVVVRLRHGLDRNGFRTVIYRHKDGKAWWE